MSCLRKTGLLRSQNIVAESNRQFKKDTEIKRLVSRVNKFDALVKSALLPDRNHRKLLKFNRKNKGSILDIDRRIQTEKTSEPRCYYQSTSSSSSADDCDHLRMPLDGGNV